MRTTFLLHAILISCLLAGCCDVCAPAQYLNPNLTGQPTPNQFEPTPTVLVPQTGGTHNGGGSGVAWSPSSKQIVIPTGNGVLIYGIDNLELVRGLKTKQAFRYAAFGTIDNLLVMVDSNFVVTL